MTLLSILVCCLRRDWESGRESRLSIRERNDSREDMKGHSLIAWMRRDSVVFSLFSFFYGVSSV
jgi:hypothetical protein